jgi:predicted MFS family arabinose efflux permease
MLRNPDFILYIASSIIIFAVAYVPATFLPDLMHEFKKSPKEVYICLMTMGLCDLVGRLLFGAFVHKMPRYMPFIHSAGVMLLSLSSGLIILSRSFGTFLIMSGILGLGLGLYNLIV